MVKKLDISSQVHNGWNGSVSILFIFLGCVSFTAVIAYACIKPVKPHFTSTSPKVLNTDDDYQKEGSDKTSNHSSPVGDNVDILSNTEQSITVKATENGDTHHDNSSAKHSPESNQNALHKIKEVFILSFTPKMALLLCFFLNCGYQQIFLTSQFTRQLVDLSSVGTLMAVFSIADVIMSNIIGCLCDRWGHTIVLTITIVSELIAFYLAWIANSQQNWTVYATGIIFAIADGGFQTEVSII